MAEALEIHEVAGGYVLRDPKLGKDHWGHVGLAIQRDANKVHGGGIDTETARKRAQLWAASEELFDACHQVLAAHEMADPEELRNALSSCRKAIAAARVTP